MKKIGILTFHKSINYGSVLQAFALSKLLKRKGYEVEIIDYEPASYNSQYRIFEKTTSVHNVAANIRRLSIFDILWKQKTSFENFRKKYLPLSKKGSRRRIRQVILKICMMLLYVAAIKSGT